MDMDSLLAKTDHLVSQFEEHLRLALQITDDPKLKVFLTHLLDEELEHRQDIAALRQGLTAQSSAQSVVVHAAAESAASADGHFQRRDQNVLTIGSLLGQAQ
jgi:hypothetical protein